MITDITSSCFFSFFLTNIKRKIKIQKTLLKKRRINNTNNILGIYIYIRNALRSSTQDIFLTKKVKKEARNVNKIHDRLSMLVVS